MQPEVFILAASMGGLLLAMLTLTGLLTLVRQRRAWKRAQESIPQAAAFVLPPSYAQQQDPVPPKVKRVMHVTKTNPIPEHLRLKPQHGTAEQVVIQIDPLDGPTRDQRNVQRLIAYLKEEGTRVNNSKAS